MKRSLTKLFSLLLTASMVFGANAQPLAKKAAKANANSVKTSVTAVAKKAPEKGERNVRPQAKVRSLQSKANSALRQARTNANVPVANLTKKTPLKEAANVPELWGSVIFADNWTEESQPAGIYTVPSSAASDFKMLVAGPAATYGAFYMDGVYYTSEVIEFWGFIIDAYAVGYDMESGVEVYRAQMDVTYTPTEMALDPTSNTVYGVASVEGIPCLVKLSFDDTFEIEDPIPLELGEAQNFNSIAFDKNGNLYGIRVNYEASAGGYVAVSSTLVSIDKTSGAITEIGETGEVPAWQTDATIDPKSGKMYWTLSPSDDSGWLCEVDLTTGAATRIYQFPFNEEVAGLVIPAPAAEPNAPAAATDLVVNFEDDALSGTVSFKTPATFFDGSAASGNLNYSILANGEEVATGSAAFDSEVSADVTLAASGLYTFVVVLSNENGDSPKTKSNKIYVGKDTPAATSATLKYEDGKMKLSWEPVTTSVNGGYFNEDAVTYTVTRYPGAVEVAKGLSATSFEEELTEPEEVTMYHYTVIAECEGMESETAESNVVVLGYILPPYTSDFVADGLDGYTIIDSNNDGYTFSLNENWARVHWNSSKAMDDWLITPPLKLESGKMYKFSAKVAGEGSAFLERIEVKLGKGATVADMTTTLFEPTDIVTTTTDPLTLNYTIIPDEDGSYFIGFHGISDADQFYLYVGDITVGAPMSALSPGLANNLKLEPWGSDESKSVAVTFTTPDKTMNGAELESVTKAELYRDGELVKTFNNPGVGKEVGCIDQVDEYGDYTYSVVCYNEEGAGDETVASIYVGINYPADLVDPKVVETSNPGEVTISWNAVTTDIAGRYLESSKVRYKVYEFAGSERIEIADTEDTSYTLQAVPEGEQDFVQYAVFPYTERGEGAGDLTDMIAVGTPYTSFSMTTMEDLDSYILGLSTYNGGEASVANDSSFSDIASLEGDDFFIYAYSQYLDGGANLFTGKISLGMDNPGFVFYTYNIAEDDINEIEVGVREVGQEEYTPVKTIVVNETGGIGWNKVVVDLSAYANKVVQISFSGTVKKYTYILFDGIKVTSLLDQDLAVDKISVPAKVKAGAAYTVDVKVLNDGMKASDSYSVELYADDKLVDTKEGAALEFGATATFQFDRTFSALAEEPVTYYAYVVYDADENDANNQSDKVEVAPIVSKLPKVSDLAGVAGADGVKLTWSEPDLSAAPAQPITEDFENAEAFANTYGDWTFVDVDQLTVGGFRDMTLPGITPGTTLGSFWIWDQSDGIGNVTFDAHSGMKYLFALYQYNDQQTDDWAISPLLDGSEQTISFWAKSYSGQYPEKIEVYVSAGSLDPADFTLVEGSTVDVVPNEWTEYSYTLPEGTKHFAIRSCAAGSFMLMVDDVTYVPADAVADLSIVGYNVYRNGEKINEAPVAETEFVDANVVNGETYNYVVTIVYTNGESAASNAVEVIAGGLGVGELYAGVKVAAIDQSVVITGAEGQNVAVYTADGKTLFAGVAEAKTVVPASKGIYLVKVNKISTKVIVK